MKEEKPDFSNIKISGVHTAEEIDSTTQNTPYIPVNNNLDNDIDMPVLKNEVVSNNVLEQPSFNAQEHVVQQPQYQIPQQNINGIVDNGSDVVIDGPMPNDDKGTFIDKLNDILNDKKKFRRVLIVCIILFVLIYYGGGTLINMMMASKLQYDVIYNGTYEDTNIGLVFRDNGKCDMDVFGLIDCEYEEKYGLYAVGFGKGLYRYIWLFKVTGNDKIKLIYETTYLTTSDDDLKKLDITFTTDGETREQLDFEEYLSSAIDSAKKTSTTTVTTTVNSKVYGVSSVNISNYDSNRDYSNNFFVENNIYDFSFNYLFPSMRFYMQSFLRRTEHNPYPSNTEGLVIHRFYRKKVSDHHFQILRDLLLDGNREYQKVYYPQEYFCEPKCRPMPLL